MIRSRLALAWVAVWLFGAAIWGVMLIVMAVAEGWPARQFAGFGLFALPMFFLVYFTVPATGALLGGFVLLGALRWLARLRLRRPRLPRLRLPRVVPGMVRDLHRRMTT